MIFDIRVFFENLSSKLKFYENLKTSIHFLNHISLSPSWTAEAVEIKTYFMFNNVFTKIVPFIR
jgi:hypothetical protein